MSFISKRLEIKIFTHIHSYNKSKSTDKKKKKDEETLKRPSCLNNT